LVLGLFFGIGCVVLAESLDKSFSNIDDLKEYFKIPVLGSIPKIVTEEERLRLLKRKKAVLKGVWVSIILFLLLAFSSIFF